MHRKCKKQDPSDSSLSDSGSSYQSVYKSKRRDKNNEYQKKKGEPIKLCSKLTVKLLTETYK